MKIRPLLGLALVALVAACSGQKPAPPPNAMSLSNTNATSLSSANATVAPSSVAPQDLPPTPLVADTGARNLGTVGIRDGLVKTEYKVRNGAGEPVKLAAIYTSCMCTTAVLHFKDGTKEGPFGMPGHDLPITSNRTLAPGETFRVEAIFDPMAHGPDAVGPVHRVIAIHTHNGSMLELQFDVDVVKQKA